MIWIISRYTKACFNNNMVQQGIIPLGGSFAEEVPSSDIGQANVFRVTHHDLPSGQITLAAESEAGVKEWMAAIIEASKV